MSRRAPNRYVSKVIKPQDFDVFWNGVLEQEANIPLEPELVHDPLRSSDDIDVYQVSYNSLDWVRISGWYCLPKEGTRPLPAILQVPGYLMEPPIPKNWAQKSYAAFSVAPRGKLRSNQQFNPGYPGLLTYSIADKNTYSYRGFYVDAWRAVDFLLTRNEVDSERIGVTGHSQGGGLTITTAAMRPQVKAAAAGAPYLCGFIDAIKLTHTYPYEEINDYLRLHPEHQKAVEQTLAYFDGINFADKIRCPIIVSIGLQDNVCPPETGYAVFNTIASNDKKLYPYEGHGHDACQYNHAAIIDKHFEKFLKH